MIRNPQLIDDMYESCKVELAALSARSNLSSYLNVNQLITKSLLLSCASFYEDEIAEIVKRVIQNSNHPESVSSWLCRVAAEGQFYKWFDFRSAKNANSFLGMFGQQFKLDMRTVLGKNNRRTDSERDFMLLCIKRNECVHRNYAAYSLDLTVEDIYLKHKSAMTFIRAVDIGARKWLMVSSGGKPM